MKNKVIFFLFTIIAISVFKQSCNAISNDFKFVIDTIGIPQYNVYGDEINEEIYYTYNVFAYSNPLSMYSRTSTQRFKLVLDKGKWTENGGPYSGYGNRGEYYVLGASYSGSLIDNVYFPVDAIPETTPDNWNYISFLGAYESWFDANNYKYVEQLEFMKNNKLLFDELDYINNKSNSYNLIEYNVIPNKVGLDKMKLNTSSTWKTMGIVTAKRINNKGQIRNAIFASKPMAASADVRSKLDVSEGNILNEDQEIVNIPIKFGANAINLNNYANEKHIKEICSTIYINGKEYAKVSGSKTVNVDKCINFTVSRDNYNTPKDYNFNVKVLSYLYTEFNVDGLMQNTIEKNITVNVKEKRIVPINDIDVKVLKKVDKHLVVSPLVQTLNTKNSNSIGFIEKDRNIAVKLSLNIESSEIRKLDIYLNNAKIDYEILNKLNNKMIISLNIPKYIENTLKSWSYLRDMSGNYFNVDFSSIGNRIKEPNTIKFIMDVNDKTYERELRIDNIDEYTINMGYQFDNCILNKSEIDNEIKLEDW